MSHTHSEQGKAPVPTEVCMVQLNLQVPIPSISNMQGGAAVGEYLFTYLDEEMLIGRAEAGTYIFLRVREPHKV